VAEMDMLEERWMAMIASEEHWSLAGSPIAIYFLLNIKGRKDQKICPCERAGDGRTDMDLA